MATRERVAWTDARIARLKELRAAGFTAQQIASDLGGVSRNAVLGRLFRMGMRLEKRAPKVAPTAAAKAPPPAVPPPIVRPKVTPVAARQETRAARCEVAWLTPGVGGISFFGLEPQHCRAPLDRRCDLGIFTFCGAPAKDGSPYCAFHHALFHADD